MADGPSGEDRERLRERVRARLDATGRSQRQLESELGWSSGTLTRVFGGRKQLDREMLAQLAEALGVSAGSLVEETSMASLLEEVSEAPPAEVAAEPASEPEPTPAPEPAEPEPEPTPAPEPVAALQPDLAAVPSSLESGETELFADRAPPEDAPTVVDRGSAASLDSQGDEAVVDTGSGAAVPGENGAPPPEEAPEDATGRPGGVRGWLRSLARRVFGGIRQG